jgi:hypothetical protein
MPDIVRPALALSCLLLLGPSLAHADGSLLVVAVEGEARAGSGPLNADTLLATGNALRAGQDGHVRLKLADGSTMTFTGPGTLIIDHVRTLPSSKGTDTSLRLNQGRIEATIRGRQHGDTRFEVRTPVAVALTRGALFRITAAPSQPTTCEVVEGSVQIADTGRLGSVSVTGGLGTRVIAGSAPMNPASLLPGPHIWTGIQLVEQKRAEIPFTPLKGAASYRMTISPGGDLFRHLVEEVVQIPRLRIESLPDGDYFVRVRAIDEHGLEGASTITRLKVRVRPDPPSLALPPDQSRLYGDSAAMGWLPDAGAASYVLQIAQDGAFRDPLRERAELREPGFVATDLRPGSYHWRVASVLKDGSQSRFSAARSFRLDPAPRPPAPPRFEGDVLRFTWAGLPGQTFVLQLAADPRFEHVVEERRTDQPGADLPRPLPGVYYARLRTTDPDGSIGPFTDAIKIAVSGKTPGAACLVEGERGLCAVYAPEPSPPH